MKVTDLMIGDWVNWHTYTDRPHYCKIKQISYDTRIEGSDNFNCEPIPLTEEIMKANGFARKPLMKRWIIDSELELIEDNMGNMVIEYWFSVSDQYICPIHYVHELQHALRLCGLNELADNFKIQ